METNQIELIQVEPRPGDRATPVVGLGLLVLILVLAGLATWLGADLARTPIEARQLAETALQQAIAKGNDEPGVKARLVELRLAISDRPLDSKTRVAYASLMLGLSRRLDDLAVASFHAGLAAKFAPVTLPVIRPAVLILTHAGHADEALALTRDVFDYDAPAGAELLERLEAQVASDDVERGLADSPDAWLAWSIHLDRRGRTAEAADWLKASSRRWPDHLGVLARRADLAVRRSDWDTLVELFPPDRRFPEDREFAVPILCRGRLRARNGDADGARADIDRALALDPDSWFVRYRAGTAYEALGEYSLARDHWNRVLFTLPDTESNRTMRGTLLHDLARLEDGHGKPATALHLWESLLELNPNHVEAQERIDDLSGFRR